MINGFGLHNSWGFVLLGFLVGWFLYDFKMLLRGCKSSECFLMTKLNKLKDSTLAWLFLGAFVAFTLGFVFCLVIMEMKAF